MKLMLLTADPVFAKKAVDSGVDRIFLDLEYINKSERQKGRNTFITKNCKEDIHALRAVVPEGRLLVRVNPLYPGSKEEIDSVIKYGADIIMLPMAVDAEDVEEFVSLVNGRAVTCPMIETASAMVHIDDILAVDGVDEIFIGLNDLHISMNLRFMFEPLSGGLIDYMADKCHIAEIPFGFGGMAKIGEGVLPAEKILAEHIRLGSDSVILSRTFRGEVDSDGKKILDLPKEIAKIRSWEEKINCFTAEDFERNRIEVKKIVNSIISEV